MTKIKNDSIIKYFIYRTPFRPVHIGHYLREKYFFRHVQALPVAKFRKVLDAGCGPGIYTKKLAAAYPHAEVTGFDVKEFASWSESPKNVRFKQQDLKQLSKENCYDLCLCIDVLEHISGNRQVLENIFRSLKPHGCFYLHMPNGKHNQRIFPKKFFKEFEKWAEDEHLGEQYTLEEMKNLFKSSGFTIIEAHNTFGFWGKLAWELDRITDGRNVFKILLMPLLKVFAYSDFWLPKHAGNGILIVGMKP